MKIRLSFLVLLGFLTAGSAMASTIANPDLNSVKAQYEKFAPAKITFDEKLLTKSEKKALDKLILAAKYMDKIFWNQAYGKNAELEKTLSKLKGDERAIYEYFLINYGPFDRLEDNRPFIKDVQAKPLGANYYPADLTKKEFEAWLAKYPNDRKAFENEFTVIVRKEGMLRAIPYSQAYKEMLEPASKLLKEAADLVDNESLKKYLVSRADAFLSNNYFESDVNWMKLKDHKLEVVFGPYEVYEDNLFGYKTAFEAFITIVDPEESKRLAKVVGYLGEMEKNLPIDTADEMTGRSLESPIIVAHEIYSSGDTRAGVQTLAFNLPNDERVRKQEGSKKVMLKNVQRAKFEQILTKIADQLLTPEDAKDVDFEAFFAHTLLHEVSHGLGPGELDLNGRKTTVNKELKDLYSTIEECKADTLGVYNNLFLIKKGLYPADFEKVIWPTYLAGIFRSVRFGVGEAHGGSNIIQFNYLREQKAILYDEKTGKFGIVRENIDSAMENLAHELLVIEARGDYNMAKKFIDKYKTMPTEVSEALKRLEKIPVDIKPIYAWE